MKGNFHARFGIGGGESDLPADHTENNAKELDQRMQIELASVMLLESLRGPCIAERGQHVAVNGEWLANASSVWPARRLF